MKLPFFLIFILFFLQSLHAMDTAMTVENKKIVWDVILSHGKPWFNHDMIRSLAINKEFDKKLRETAGERKRCIEQQPNFKCFSKQKFDWHPYGIACRCVSDVENIYSRKRGTRVLAVCLMENEKFKLKSELFECQLESHGCFSKCFAGIIAFFEDLLKDKQPCGNKHILPHGCLSLC